MNDETITSASPQPLHTYIALYLENLMIAC